MSLLYDDYLAEHIDNVNKGLHWMQDNLELNNDEKNALENAISTFNHDASKYDREEYLPYDEYFYGGNRSYQVVQDFNYAWLRHIHHNPHHWQYWVLLEDDPQTGDRFKALAMPLYYIFEMIADWWSFSWKNENLGEIFTWYDSHRDKMILHRDTRRIVEDILWKIREKVVPEEELIEHSGIKGQKWGVKNGPPYPLGSKEKLNGVKKLNDLMNNGWDYGVLDNGKHLLDTEDYDWDKNYRTTPVDTLEKEKIGTCWDYVNYQHDKLKNMGIKDDSYLITIQKSEKPNDIVTHTFTTFELGDKKYWLESAAWPKRGVHEINGIEDVANELNEMYHLPGFGLSVFKYNPEGMDKGLTSNEFFDKASQDLVYDVPPLKHSDSMAHSGIKGQKWGVRRYQNYDGTLTEEGKIHYGKTVFVSGSSKTQLEGNQYYRKELPKEVKDELDRYIKGEGKILVGDAPGIDRQVQDYLNKKNYNNVEVYGPGKEVRYSANENWKTNPIDDPDHEPGSKEWLAKKDKAMSDAADDGLAVILDEGSKATRENIRRMVLNNKDTKVFELSKNGSENDKWSAVNQLFEERRDILDKTLDQELSELVSMEILGTLGFDDDELRHSDDEEDPHQYGVPEQKKFPLPDKDHVLSAIRFFNYVDPKYEKELAKAILEKIEEYGVNLGEDITVGEENKFKKYIPEKEQDS